MKVCASIIPPLPQRSAEQHPSPWSVWGLGAAGPSVKRHMGQLQETTNQQYPGQHKSSLPCSHRHHWSWAENKGENFFPDRKQAIEQQFLPKHNRKSSGGRSSIHFQGINISSSNETIYWQRDITKWGASALFVCTNSHVRAVWVTDSSFSQSRNQVNTAQIKSVIISV